MNELFNKPHNSHIFVLPEALVNKVRTQQDSTIYHMSYTSFDTADSFFDTADSFAKVPAGDKFIGGKQVISIAYAFRSPLEAGESETLELAKAGHLSVGRYGSSNVSSRGITRIKRYF